MRLVDEQGDVQAHGVVVLGAPRAVPDVPDGPGWLGLRPPAELEAGPEAVPVVPVGPPLGPEFLTQIELRPLRGLPFSGDTSPEVVGWLSPRGRIARVDAALVAALADTWWVTVMPRLERPRPVGTLTYSLDIPGDPQWLKVRTRWPPRAPAASQHPHCGPRGVHRETRELWTADGRLLTWNTRPS